LALKVVLKLNERRIENRGVKPLIGSGIASSVALTRTTKDYLMFRILACLLSAIALSGCALISDTVDIQYHSTTATAPLLGAGQVRVEVAVNDGRTGRPDQIGVKKNGYGMEMAPILASRPVPDLVRDALVLELRKEGFDIGPGGMIVVVDVTKFSNDFKMGFFSGDAASEAILGVQVRNPAGRIVYSRTIAGDNSTGGVFIAGGDNAKASLERSLSNAIAKLMADPAFSRAILDTARGPIKFSS